MEITSIRLSRKTLKDLRKLQVHPRETNEDIIKRLITESKSKAKVKEE